MPKEGAVNLKKRTKFCTEAQRWIPFSQWKKHKEKMANLVGIESKEYHSLVPFNPEVDFFKSQIKKLEVELQSLSAENRELKIQQAHLRIVIGDIGRAFVNAFGSELQGVESYVNTAKSFR